MELEWVPSSCTLPTAERPLREAEFDALFSAAVGVTRPSPGELRIAFPASEELAATAASHAVRETQCCSLFTFTVTVAARELTLGVSVGERHVEVLDALAARVRS
jgi:hypothetical protein